MKKSHFLIKVLILFFFFDSIGIAKESSYFIEGKKYFENKEFDKSKILFEKDIVFNPKSEKSYLYLAKIFNAIHKMFPEATLTLIGSDAPDVYTNSSSTWELMQKEFTETAFQKVTYKGKVPYPPSPNAPTC